MALHDVLVHLKPWEEWSGHIDYAIALAAAHQARLIGVTASNQVALLEGFFLRSDPVVAEQLAKAEAQERALADRLRGKAATAGVSARVEICHGPGSEVIAWASLFADLTVVEQTEPHDELDHDIAEQAVFAARGGVIVVPRGATPAPPARIVIGWNGTRESANAIRAAMPLIERAQSVRLLQGPRRPVYPAVRRGPTLTMEDTLRGRTANLTAEAFAPDERSAGRALLEAASGADLLVMGAYGRSRLTEFILGGATREALKRMTLPILLAH